MNKLKVVDFGPIKKGYLRNGGFMEFPKVTVFCGHQGSGKSSVAKLYSSLVWMEKTVFRYWLEDQDSGGLEFFLSALQWQGIDSYLKKTTEIVYVGEYASLSYRNGRFSCEVRTLQTFFRPCQIMYIPAERNVASIIRDANSIRGLPKPLENMQVSFQEAKMSMRGGYKLPANGYVFKYDDSTKESWIVNGAEKNETRLELASSGLQSLVPLLVGSDNLNKKVAKDSRKTERVVESARDELMCREVLKGVKEELAQGKIDDAAYGSVLAHLYAPNQGLVNVVEEPEQNLYPETQCDVVCQLLAIVREIEKNQLVISTHSPYVVNALVSAQMAAEILSLSREKKTVDAVGKVFPPASAVSQRDMALYELSEDGEITLLPTNDGIFSDSNLLNSVLGRWNDSFDQLLEIEARLNG